MTMSSVTSINRAALRAVWDRLQEDDGFSDLPVVVGLVVSAGALGAALAAIPWDAAATALGTAVETAMTTAGGGGA